MRRPPLIGTRADPSSGTGDSPLRPEHPLVLATDALERVVRQWLLVAALLAGSVAAGLDDQAWSRSLTLAGGTALAVLSVIALGLRQRKRRRAIDLILEGQETIAVAAVQHERCRFLSARGRTGLARSFQHVIDQASYVRPRPRGAQPLFHLWVVRDALDDLRELVPLLQAPRTSARGLAYADRLIGHGGSPLYGADVPALRAELRRVKQLLCQ